MDKTFLLIDGSSFIFRAYHAMPELTSPDGKPTGATYGIVNMLKQLQKKYPTQHFVCIFDTKGETFRDQIHPEYKANRAETPDTLIPQFEDIYHIIDALGIPVIKQTGIEADDIIGTLAIQAKQAGYKVIIATGDKDFTQLVDDHIILVNTMNNETLDSMGVVSKFGVPPTQMIDYLSLVGDKADNIPGVDKCGPKTAVKWLTQYGSIENMFIHQNELTGVVGENFRKAAEGWLATAKTLVTIHTGIDVSEFVPNGFDHLKLGTPNITALKEIYSKLGFNTWFKQLENNNHEEVANNRNPLNTKKTNDSDEIVRITPQQPIITKLVPQKTKLVTLKNETELSNVIHQITKDNNIIGLSVIPDNFDKPTRLRYVTFNVLDTSYFLVIPEVANSYDLFGSNDSGTSDYTTILRILFQSNNPKTLVNYKDSLHVLSLLGFQLNNVTGDLTLAHYIQNSRARHNLSTIYQELMDLVVTDIPNSNNKLTKDSIWLTNNLEAITRTLELVTSNCIMLEQHIVKQLSSLELKLYQDVEMVLVPVLVKMENDGIKLDIPAFKLLDNELNTQLKILENQIYLDANCVFNISSPKQLQDVLFGQLKLPTTGLKKNVNGYSTDEDTLKVLEGSGITLATKLLEYRNLSKLLNTYVNKLPLLVDSEHKVHTTYEQAIVASGRLSSKDPNLQNIPVKNTWGKLIRRAFIADNGHKLICADYSQIELRILAHLSQDTRLIEAFNNNEDIHTITASEIFHKNFADITKDERRYAKTINFSLIYGKTAFGLAQELGIDRSTAKLYIDTYFAKYPKVLSCLESIKAQARCDGYVQTILGRRVYLPNINAKNKIIRDSEERLALNAPMQGTSADIIKIAMNNIDTWLIQNKLRTKIILQIHDELILQAPDDEVELVTTNLEGLMANGTKLAVKLAVDIKVADNWDEGR